MGSPAPRYDEAPEVAPSRDYPPEVTQAERQHQQYPQAFVVPHAFTTPLGTPPAKPEGSPPSPYAGLAPPSSYSTAAPNSASSHDVATMLPPGKRRATVCGCSLLVFVLALIIAVLSAAVIGLAAGTGVEASRAHGAEAKAARLSSSLTRVPTATVTVAPTATAFADLDNNCSNDPDGVSNTTYTAFKLFDGPSFTMHCNKDAAHTPLLSLFVADFNGCMDACAAWSFYTPKVLSGGGDNTNATCTGVSFIPLWTDRSSALQGGAPGNCYLKPGTQPKSLPIPNIGTECHAAVLNTP